MKPSLPVFTVLLGVVVLVVGSSCVQLGQGPAAGRGTISEFPDYPGAMQVEFKQGSDAEEGFTRKTAATWTSTTPYQAVVAHYRKAISDGGWTVTAVESKPTKITWKLAKDTSIAEVEIKQTAPVTIKVERRDR